MAGLIIFPACFAYNIEPDRTEPDIITLPNVFMPGEDSGNPVFLFMPFAAASTVTFIQNIVSFATDLSQLQREKAVVEI